MKFKLLAALALLAAPALSLSTSAQAQDIRHDKQMVQQDRRAIANARDHHNRPLARADRHALHAARHDLRHDRRAWKRAHRHH